MAMSMVFKVMPLVPERMTSVMLCILDVNDDAGKQESSIHIQTDYIHISATIDTETDDLNGFLSRISTLQ